MTKAYLEVDEVRELEEAAEYLRDKLLIRLVFRLGCRISEAQGIGIKWQCPHSAVLLFLSDSLFYLPTTTRAELGCLT